jgi:hypothetical protein
MAIRAGKDITGDIQLRIEHHQRLAGQGSSGRRAQWLQAMLAGREAIAIQILEPIPRQQRGARPVHGLDQDLGLAGDVAHQCLGGRQLDPLQFPIDGDDGSRDVGMTVRGVNAGLRLTDNLQHQSDQR